MRAWGSQRGKAPQRHQGREFLRLEVGERREGKVGESEAGVAVAGACGPGLGAAADL